MDLYARVHEMQRRREAGVLCTVIRSRGSVPRHAGSKMLVGADGAIVGSIGGGELEDRVARDALAALQACQPCLVHYSLHNPNKGDPGVCGGEVEIFLEPFGAKPVLLVVGAGHVGRALVHLASWLGFRVVVADDRPEHCNAETTPGADEYCCTSIALLAQRRDLFGANTYIVMPTRSAPVDVEGLPHLFAVEYAYLGVIGSRRRWATVRQELRQRGVAEDELARVHAPMGLELNAETPEEIAVSVMAEILMLRHDGTGQSMQLHGNVDPT